MQIKRAKYKEIEQIPTFQIKKEFKEDFFGSSPAPFVGRFGYPEVNIGVLSPQFLGEVGNYDNPGEWNKQNFSIYQIAGMRYEMVNSQQKVRVKGGRDKILEICQEVGMAAKPVELEVNLEEKPRLKREEGQEIISFGPTGRIRKARITSNPRVDSRVEKAVGDIDLKAKEAILSLYEKGFEENFLTKLISVGNLGLKKDRKLVPTRWSITAIDDMLGKKIREEIKRLPAGGEYKIYFGGGWGNYYLILMFPEIWSFELFETYLEHKVNPWSKSGSFYSTDYEDYEGRKDYAEECAGGYYAARLAVLEKMKEGKRQHSALILRFITPEYNIPLGVWVCREAARRSLGEKPIGFGSKELMLKYCEELVKNKFGFDINLLLKESRLLKKINTQSKLNDFSKRQK